MPSANKSKFIPANPTLTNGMKQLRAYFPYKQDEKKDAKIDEKNQGSHNQCRIIKIPVKHETRDPDNFVSEPTLSENKEIDIAILSPLRYEEYKKKCKGEAKSEAFYQEAYQREIKYNTADIKRSFQHLQQAKPSTFVADFLYHGTQGRVAKAANGSNLFSWLQDNRNQISDEEVKEITAQIPIAIKYWHSQNKIHRDIKPENFLVYITNTQPRRIHIKLADLDTLMSVDEKPVTSAGTIGFLAPECTVSIEHEVNGVKTTEEIFDSDKYIKALKKPVDCFAVGKTIDDILHCIWPDKKSENQELRSLSSALTNKDPLLRMTIDQAMEHPYFGDSPQARSNYFESIHEKYKKTDEYFNGIYRQSLYPEYDDAFFILPESLQNIYIQADLVNVETHWLFDIDYPLEISKKEKIEANITNLKNMIKDYEDSHSDFMDMDLIEAFLNIKNGIEKAENVLAENSLKKDTRPDFAQSFSYNINDGRNITCAYLENYFFEENLGVVNSFLTFLQNRTERQKRNDLKNALNRVDEYISTLNTKNDEHIRKLLQNYSNAVSNKMASDIPIENMPDLTELTHRLLFKVKNPTLAVNLKNSTNTCRAESACQRISHFTWGRFVGGLALFILGASLTTIAGCSIAASMGATTPFALALAKLGVETAAVGAAYAFSEVIYAFYKRRFKKSGLLSTGIVTASLLPLSLSAPSHTSVLSADIANQVVNVTAVSTATIAGGGLAIASGVSGMCKGLYRMFTHQNKKIHQTAEAILQFNPLLNLAP